MTDRSETADIVDRIRRWARVADDAGTTEDAADEIERLRGIIIAALDCLHHDDPKMARKILAGDVTDDT